MANAKNKTNILIFGDSIAFGKCDIELNGWINRLSLHLQQYGTDDYTIFNMGICGQTSQDIIERFDSEISCRLNKDEQNKVVFAIGINDTQVIDGQDRVGHSEFKQNIKTLIKLAKLYTSNVAFIGLTTVDESRVTPFEWNKSKCCYNQRIITFDNIIQVVALSYNCQYVKMLGVLSPQDLADGLHPNQSGHQKMFEHIYINLFK